MQHLFTRANDALCEDLERYATTLRAIVEALPRAKALCERVVAEVRLVQALLAFGEGAVVAPLNMIALQITNLWGVREDLPVRASGFSNQIAESVHAREQAARALALVNHQSDDSLATELRTCFRYILGYLEEQEHILETCEERLRPFRESPELTRKRLNLLIAAAEARLPDTPTRRTAVETYAEASALLSEWEGGITLDGRGIGVLERCLDLINKQTALDLLNAPASPDHSAP